MPLTVTDLEILQQLPAYQMKLVGEIIVVSPSGLA